jgi:drug/metabolite transporter (DMT)-like permease
MPVAPKKFPLGSLYSLATGVLLATQEPFSALAAKHLPVFSFICLTQASLLLSVPAFTARSRSRRDFTTLLSSPGYLGKLLILFLIGVAGLLFYNLGLRNAHPIIISAILNLSPFWAALVAKIISGKAIPISPRQFWPCFAIAFIGAMLITISQVADMTAPTLNEFVDGLIHGSWKYGIPVPIFFALSGTLIGRWFKGFDESGTISANFVVSALVLIPATLLIGGAWPVPAESEGRFAAALLVVGTLTAAAAGRVVYQMALTVTDNDNGFVTMFFLLVPGLSSLISLCLSSWISDLRFTMRPMFFAGLALVAAPLFIFAAMSRKVINGDVTVGAISLKHDSEQMPHPP